MVKATDGSEFMNSGSGLRVQGHIRFMVQGLILVQGSQFMVHGYLWLRIKGSRQLMVQDS